MMKHAWLSILFLSMVAAAGSAYAEDALACETQLVNFKRREYRCLLTANGGGQQIRFKADFAGSHDDTQLSISLTLDDLPVTCSKGSKTWLNGEDGETGDVSLQCHLILDGAAGTQRMLRAVINIYHAGFVGLQLSAL
jgi:hypothetical protein